MKIITEILASLIAVDVNGTAGVNANCLRPSLLNL
jgi:hypothetical protein